MPTPATLYGYIRSITGVASSDSPAVLNERQEQIVALGLPAYTEMTRRGNGWSTMSTSAVAGLVVRPTTTAAFEIYNAYGTGGPCLVIDRLFAHNLVATAVATGWNLWAAVTAPKAAVTSGSFAVRGNTGKAYTGPVIAAASTTVIDSGWFPWTPSAAYLGAATPIAAQVVNVEGRLIVPPGCSLCLHVVAAVTGDTFTQGASWYEEVLSGP